MVRLVLLRLSESFFRHRWLYLLPIVIMTIVAGLYPSTVQSTYIARGNIYIQKETLLASLTALQNDGFGWVTPAQATVSELDELFSTDAFMRAVIQQTDLSDAITGEPRADNELIRQIRMSSWVYPLGNNLVAISASHEDPRIAYQVATGIINTYSQWKINLKLEEGIAAQDFFIELVESYQAELEPVRRELTDYLTLHPEPLRGDRPATEVAEIARLQALIDQSLERLQNAESKEENARLAMVQTESDVRQTYFTVDEPVIPAEPERSLREIAIVMALCVAAGFVLTGLAVVGGALLDRTYRFPIDISHELGLPVVASVPQAREDPQFEAHRATAAHTLEEEMQSSSDAGSTPRMKPRKPQQIFGLK